MTDRTLADLGWSAHFERQLGSDAIGVPARLCAIHRDRLEALGGDGRIDLASRLPMAELAVGDWVLHDGVRALRRLESFSLVSRRAAGGTRQQQRIAANVDTLGIVTSCNADFKVPRLERYLAVAAAAGALPLVILTKADLAEDVPGYRRTAERLGPLVAVVTLDARDPDEVARLAPWCGAGQTIALVGSSGVGKTTLGNVLTGLGRATAGIREDDARGRHTTTGRAMWRTTTGGWLIDTPGMRELGLSEAGEGIDEVFEDMSDLARQCRFSDCRHESEPGCAIRAAIAAGNADEARLERWQRLLREDAHNSRSLAEARSRDRARQKLYDEGKRRGRYKRGGRGPS